MLFNKLQIICHNWTKINRWKIRKYLILYTSIWHYAKKKKNNQKNPEALSFAWLHITLYTDACSNSEFYYDLNHVTAIQVFLNIHRNQLLTFIINTISHLTTPLSQNTSKKWLEDNKQCCDDVGKVQLITELPYWHRE